MYNMLLGPALDNVLKLVTHFAHDWMHTLVVHGAWNTLMFAMLTCLIAAGVDDAPRTARHVHFGVDATSSDGNLSC